MYFHSDGRAKVPNCNQGSHCRFLHPDDEDWPGMKPKPQEKRVASSASSQKDRRYGLPDKPRTANSPPFRSEPRSAPLVSQDDLFLSKILSEEDPTSFSSKQARRQSMGPSDDYRDRGRDNKRSKDVPPRSDSGNRSRPYDDFSYLGVMKPSGPNHSPNAYTQRPRVVSGTKRKYQDVDQNTLDSTFNSNSQFGNQSKSSNHTRDAPASKLLLPAILGDAPGTQLNIPGSDLLRSGELQEEVTTLFRELSRLASQATEDAESHARDDKKLKAYTELSYMLSKISPKTAAAVMPTLADILLRHVQGKQRAEDNLKAISGVWNKVFDLFTAEIARTVDSMLGEAIKKLAGASELANNSTVSHRSLSTSDSTGKSSKDQDKRYLETRSLKESELDFRRDQKRRRFSNMSPSPVDRSPPPAQSIVKVEHNMHLILSQMKTKIDEQAQYLHKLTKENNELKASLHQHRPPCAAHPEAI